jgi:hypothetical protein
MPRYGNSRHPRYRHRQHCLVGLSSLSVFLHRPARIVVGQFYLSPPRPTIKNGSVSHAQPLIQSTDEKGKTPDIKKLRKLVCDLCCLGRRMTTHLGRTICRRRLVHHIFVTLHRSTYLFCRNVWGCVQGEGHQLWADRRAEKD